MFILFIAGCKKECEKSSDCAEKTCNTASCAKGACEYNIKANCCGNGIKDKIEDGKQGNKCTCPKDYGSCTGKNGTYMERFCTENNDCVFGVPDEKIQNLKVLSDKSTGYFNLEIKSEYDSPFIINKSVFTATITLKDDNERLVYPIKFTDFKLLERDLILGEKTANLEFNRVGDSASIDVPFEFSMQKPEEQRTVYLRVEYEYNYKVSNGQELARSYFDVSYRDKFLLINPGLVK